MSYLFGHMHKETNADKKKNYYKLARLRNSSIDIHSKKKYFRAYLVTILKALNAI